MSFALKRKIHHHHIIRSHKISSLELQFTDVIFIKNYVLSCCECWWCFGSMIKFWWSKQLETVQDRKRFCLIKKINAGRNLCRWLVRRFVRKILKFFVCVLLFFYLIKKNYIIFIRMYEKEMEWDKSPKFNVCLFSV